MWLSITGLLATYAGEIVRLLIGTLFLIGAVEQGSNLRQSTEIVQNYRLLPSIFVTPFAAGLPVAEAFVGAGLILVPSFLAIVAATFLLCIFAVAILINLARGRSSISCGCGWGASSSISRELAMRNIALAVVIFSMGFNSRPAQAIEILICGFCAGLLVILLTALDRISNAPRNGQT